MTVIELLSKRQGKMRVWLEEFPDSHYVVSEVLQYQLSADDLSETQQRCVAIEIVLHQGGYNPYGLLGAYFVPVRSDRLTIEVHISSEDGRIAPTTLAGGMDKIKIGLPQEYAESVLAGAISASSLSRLGAGRLCFDCAAHGEIGSSTNIFHRLAMLVVELLVLGPETILAGELTEIIESFFRM